MDQSLADMFHHAVSIAIDADGVYPHQARRRTKAGIQVFALDLSHMQVMDLTIQRARESETEELIFGLDRLTKPGQGTEFEDVLPAAWFRKGVGWKVGVINYQPDPLIVRPWDWHNVFWISTITHELIQAGAPELVEGSA